MLPPRIKIATDVLRSLAKSLEQFSRHNTNIHDARQKQLSSVPLIESLRSSLTQQASRHVQRHFTDLLLLTENDVEMRLSRALDDKHHLSDKNQYWILEPLSGPENFLRGSGEHSLRLSEMQGPQLIFSLIYLPKTDELYCAERGYGIRLNQHRVRAFKPISSEIPWRIGGPSALSQLSICIEHFKSLAPSQDIDHLQFHTGSDLICQLANLCSGRLDACWSGELLHFQKKVTAFWIKEGAFTRHVVQALAQAPERSWIFGRIPAHGFHS